jgi:hypothetical protein
VLTSDWVDVGNVGGSCWTQATFIAKQLSEAYPEAPMSLVVDACGSPAKSRAGSPDSSVSSINKRTLAIEICEPQGIPIVKRAEWWLKRDAWCLRVAVACALGGDELAPVLAAVSALGRANFDPTLLAHQVRTMEIEERERQRLKNWDRRVHRK